MRGWNIRNSFFGKYNLYRVAIPSVSSLIKDQPVCIDPVFFDKIVYYFMSPVPVVLVESLIFGYVI